MVIEGNRAVRQEILLKDIGRLRDVASGPDGWIYVAVNDPGKIIRLIAPPASTTAASSP